MSRGGGTSCRVLTMCRMSPEGWSDVAGSPVAGSSNLEESKFIRPNHVEMHGSCMRCLSIIYQKHQHLDSPRPRSTATLRCNYLRADGNQRRSNAVEPTDQIAHIRTPL